VEFLSIDGKASCDAGAKKYQYEPNGEQLKGVITI
jgi:hypothetical protein